MIKGFLKLFAGRSDKKFIKQCTPIIAKINKLEEEFQQLSDEQLQAKTIDFKKRYEGGESLESLLPEAYAVVKNAARRLQGTVVDVCGQHQTWNMVHYDVQLMGGIALHQNKIAEMATGEGKTFVVTLPLYLNALTGKNCQLVTVNDYLARRDSEWMGALYKFLGLSVGCTQNGMSPVDRLNAYAADITYGTASEFGFDYLRDNGMAVRAEEQVQRDHYFCIVDEADSVLIDEARTPLIISGTVDTEQEAPFRELRSDVQSLVAKQVKFCNRLVSEAKAILAQEKLKPEDQDEALVKLFQVRQGDPRNKQLMRIMEDPKDRKAFEKFDLEMNGDLNRERRHEFKEELFFVIDEKQNQADLTEKGRNTLRPNNPEAFVMPDLPTRFVEIEKMDISDEAKQKLKVEAEGQFSKASEDIHCLSQLLRAYCLYEKDIQYVLQENKVVIIDENTGRAMPGRRWSDGLHQAIEAKENVAIEKESKTYATITIQNYFRMYEKLAGMTGTAETEASEFFDIYKLAVVSLPTHKPCLREHLNDVIYKTRREKYNAAIAEVKQAYEKGQPVLLGTTSVEASEVLSKLLKRERIVHTVLNAKHHESEADIVAKAGQKGAVTIATNMAGRGTDIKLGEGVVELGGLKVIGTERHESRRIDRQLVGRCSRQGDPGSARFYISLEDDLMRLFANAGPISKVLENTFKEGDVLEHPLINRSIGSAQKKVEDQNYSVRKKLLQYDNVLNKQREVIYSIRNDAIYYDESAPRRTRDIIFEMINEELEVRLEDLDSKGNWSSDKAKHASLGWINSCFPVALRPEDTEGLSQEDLMRLITERLAAAYKEKEAVEDPEALRHLESFIIVRALDKNWQGHLTEMEELRRSVGLRSYGQKDPLNEYKSEAFVYFQEMLASARTEMCRSLFRSASSVKVFNNMLSRLSSKAKVTGPGVSENAQQPVKEGKFRSRPTSRELPKVKAMRAAPKVGRNDVCPCGSGKKYKKCCGAAVLS